AGAGHRYRGGGRPARRFQRRLVLPDQVNHPTVLDDAAVRLAGNTPRAEAPSPAALLRDLTSRFEALGITRLAGQTGLDRTGIPCYAASRPTSLTIATHQGKGVDDVGARISAIMEAAEYAVAEAPDTPDRVLSLAEVRAAGLAALDVTGLLP